MSDGVSEDWESDVAPWDRIGASTLLDPAPPPSRSGSAPVIHLIVAVIGGLTTIGGLAGAVTILRGWSSYSQSAVELVLVLVPLAFAGLGVALMLRVEQARAVYVVLGLSAMALSVLSWFEVAALFGTQVTPWAVVRGIVLPLAILWFLSDPRVKAEFR
jgi:hypothetical protein